MNTRLSFHILGTFIKILGVFMLVPAVCSLIYGEDDVWVFVASFGITSVFGLLMERALKDAGSIEELGRKEGFFITSLFWVLGSIFGALPFLLSGVLTNPIDAVFESVSGFTTTGATVIADVEAVSHGIVFWRSFTQWIGGLGIIVLAIAILPNLSIGGMQLMALQVTGPAQEKFAPRIAETAKSLWITYAFFSLLMVGLLMLAGMPLYDSLIHMFSAISTGGFSSKNLSVGAYDSVAIEIIVMIFMLVGGTNFYLLYGVLRMRPRELLSNPEFRFYVAVNAVMISAVALYLWMGGYMSLPNSLRYSSFGVITISTGTGFASSNFDLWPSFPKGILFLCFFIGGCAGGTSGAIKCVRVFVVLKKLYHELYSLVHPKAVLPLRLGKRVLDPSLVLNISIFCIAYVGIFLVGSLLVSLEGVSLVTATSATATCLGNVGPGFELVGPMSNFSQLSNFSKVVLSAVMVFGRLEIFTILVLFVPVYWRK